MSAIPDPARTRQLGLILDQVDALPTLSPIATRLLKLGAGDDADLPEIVRLIGSDPALSARILGLCRRADRGLSGRITTVQRAVVMLGLDAVRCAVLSVCAYDLMQRPRSDLDAALSEPGVAADAGFDRTGFWEHAIAVACASEMIAESHPTLAVQPEEAFVAGLLHDLGKLVLDLVLPRAYARICAAAWARRCDITPIERSVLGLDHHTAGKRLAERWELPPMLQDAIWLHGQAALPPEQPHAKILAVVSAAKIVARRLHLGWSGDFTVPPTLAAACAPLRLDPARMDALIIPLQTAVAERYALLGLRETTGPEVMLHCLAGANRQLGRLNDELRQRAGRAQRLTVLLDAIAAFHRSVRPDAPEIEVLGQVARSASAVLGAGFCATLDRPQGSQNWRLALFNSQGVLSRTDEIEPPRGASDPGALFPSGDAGHSVGVAAIALLPWLADALRDAPDFRQIRLTPLSLGDGTPPSALLLHDRDAGTPGLGAIAATWAAALCAASARDQARRSGERLADANRSLIEAQAQLTEAQSLARLGEMTAGAAHEMNNPLTVINGRSQLLARALTVGREKAAAQSIVEASRHLSDIITSLHLLASPPTPKLRECELSDIILDATAMARERLGSGLKYRRAAGPEIGVVHADPQLLAGALCELLINAQQACPLEPMEVLADTDPDEDALRLHVRDRGPGFTEHALAHAFDPFFCERPAGRRRGLGLTRALTLARAMGGVIRLANIPASGASAVISIPGCRAPASSRPPADPIPMQSGLAA